MIIREKLIVLGTSMLVVLSMACGGADPTPPPPTITSFAATAPTIYAGQSTILVAGFAGGTAIVDHGVGAITSGVGVSVSPTATTTYLITVTNTASVAVTQTATVTVNPAPSFTLALDPVALPITIGNNSTVSVAATRINGQSAVINLSLVGAPSGITGTGIIEAGAESGNLTINVGSAVTAGVYNLIVQGADGSLIHTAPVTVTATPAAPPSITSFDLSQTMITTGDPVTLTAVFTGGAGTIHPSAPGTSFAILSGTPITIKPGYNVSYYLTVTNGSGAVATSAQKSVLVNQVSGYGVSVIWTPIIMPPGFARGVVTGPGGFNSPFTMVSGGMRSANPSTPGTYTVTVTQPWYNGRQTLFPRYLNQDVVVTEGTMCVQIQWIPLGLTANRSSIQSGESTTLIARSVSGTVDQGVGPVLANALITVSPTVTTTYTLTGTGGLKSTVTITVL